MMKFEKQKRVNVDLANTFKIFEFLKEVLVQEADGYWKYVDNWDDGVVAAEMASRLKIEVTKANVLYIRQKMLGRLRPWAKGPEPMPKVSDDEAVAKFEAVMEKILGNVASRLDNLESRVTVNAQSINSTIQNFEARLVELEKNLIFARHLSATRIAGRVEELETQVREQKIEMGKLKLKAKFA